MFVKSGIPIRVSQFSANTPSLVVGKTGIPTKVSQFSANTPSLGVGKTGIPIRIYVCMRDGFFCEL